MALRPISRIDGFEFPTAAHVVECRQYGARAVLMAIALDAW